MQANLVSHSLKVSGPVIQPHIRSFISTKPRLYKRSNWTAGENGKKMVRVKIQMHNLNAYIKYTEINGHNQDRFLKRNDARLLAKYQTRNI